MKTVTFIAALFCTPAFASNYQRVVLISFDGLSAKAFEGDKFLPEIFREGFYTRARTTNPPCTLSSHASMLSCVPPEIHSITWNSYKPERGTIKVPTLFEILHNNGWRTVAIIGKEKLRQLLPKQYVDRIYETGYRVEALETAGNELENSRVFLFIHIAQADNAGHAWGWGSAEYKKQVEINSGLLRALLWQYVYDPGTLMIVTSDHGGQYNVHPSQCQECFIIPIAVKGKGVPNLKIVDGNASTVDTSLTIMRLLGLKPPSTCTGEPLWH